MCQFAISFYVVILPCNPTLKPLHCFVLAVGQQRQGGCVCACASFYCHFTSLEPRGKSKGFSSGPVKGRASGADQRRFRRHCWSLAGGSAARARWRTGVGAGAWWGRGGGGGGGGISSLWELLDSPVALDGRWGRCVLELVRTCVQWVWLGVGVRAKHMSPSESWRQGRP